MDPGRKKQATRTKAEAEAILRKVLKDLREAGEDIGDPSKLEKATPTLQKLCREVSECPTAQKGGASCGDLGWMTKEQLKQMGETFEEAASSLKVGRWSDIVSSEQGLHLLLRML